jgi:hypothetical protein
MDLIEKLNYRRFTISYIYKIINTHQSSNLIGLAWLAGGYIHHDNIHDLNLKKNMKILFINTTCQPSNISIFYLNKGLR